MSGKDQPHDDIIPTILKAYPVQASTIFDVLQKATVKSAACIYGGALRDTDCSHFYAYKIPVNDFDMRVWLPNTHFHALIDIVRDTFTTEGATVNEVTYWESDTKKEKPRCEILFQEAKIDMSFRGVDPGLFSDPDLSAKIAQDRAKDSNIGLSAIAMDDKNRVWIAEQYLYDRGDLLLTIMDKRTPERSLQYAKRLKDGTAEKPAKYPMHSIIEPK